MVQSIKDYFSENPNTTYLLASIYHHLFGSIPEHSFRCNPFCSDTLVSYHGLDFKGLVSNCRTHT